MGIAIALGALARTKPQRDGDKVPLHQARDYGSPMGIFHSWELITDSKYGVVIKLYIIELQN
jgi:hypothetical protein